MKTETISYTESNDAFDAYVAYPDGDGPHPVVLVCHAWGGRGEFEEDKARKLAELGYIGAAVDVYGVGKRGTDVASNQALMMPLVEDQALLARRLTAGYEAVRGLAGVDTGRMALTGYCFGGLCATLAARTGLDLRGVVSFHGLLNIGAPLDNEIKAELLILHGQDDPMVSPEDITAFTAEMKRVNATWQFHSYAGVLHAFTNPAANDRSLGAMYSEDADRRSWVAMERFLGDVLA